MPSAPIQPRNSGRPGEWRGLDPLLERSRGREFQEQRTRKPAARRSTVLRLDLRPVPRRTRRDLHARRLAPRRIRSGRSRITTVCSQSRRFPSPPPSAAVSQRSQHWRFDAAAGRGRCVRRVQERAAGLAGSTLHRAADRRTPVGKSTSWMSHRIVAGVFHSLASDPRL